MSRSGAHVIYAASSASSWMNLAWYLGEICRSVQPKGSMFKIFLKIHLFLIEC